jgi:hypothetical protein
MPDLQRPLTIFAIPKAFRGMADTHQRNALASWLALDPRPRVILIGDDPGTAEVAADMGVEHVPQVERNEFGTPLLRSIFALAHERVDDGLMLFLNFDIILTSDIMGAIALLPEDNFLMTGRRTCMYLRHLLDFNDPGCEAELRRLADATGRLWGENALDYFVFPHTMFRQVPNFAIGRGWWDHWLVAEALRQQALLIDATPSVLAVHQNHNFLGGIEAVRNLALFGQETNSISIRLAETEVRDGALRYRGPKRQRPLLNALLRAYEWPLKVARRVLAA